ncbi:MAG: beta-galactosidase [Patescibacteria group bacterium]
MEIGVTFSHKHIKDLGLDLQKSLQGLKSLKIKWVRLCCYWDEIEAVEGTFNYSTINTIVNFCELNKISIILSIGMKSPRYPEYYIPNWLNNRIKLKRNSLITVKDDYLLNKTKYFIKKTIIKFKKYKSIKIWQVENEPLDPSGENWFSIDKDFLKEEISLIKGLDPTREIMVNLWGNLLSARKNYKQAIKLADIVGIDLYLRCPVVFLKFFFKFMGPLDNDLKLNFILNKIRKSGKKVFIAELQMEPWEPNEIITQKNNPRSFLPKHFVENIKYAKSLNPEITFLWGYEYWLWRKARGDKRYWDEALNYFTKK